MITVCFASHKQSKCVHVSSKKVNERLIPEMSLVYEDIFQYGGLYNVI